VPVGVGVADVVLLLTFGIATQVAGIFVFAVVVDELPEGAAVGAAHGQHVDIGGDILADFGIIALAVEVDAVEQDADQTGVDVVEHGGFSAV